MVCPTTSAFIELSAGDICCRVSDNGGAIVDAYFGDTSVLRPYTGTHADYLDILQTACYPLVPFGGRVAGNAFEFEGKIFSFIPNTEFDQYYLHGDGWLERWAVDTVQSDSVQLSMRHPQKKASPYDYSALQKINLGALSIEVSITVTNEGDSALPYGLGFHPFFPLTNKTTLCARAGAFWSEKSDFLPGELGSVPDDLNFKRPAPVPPRWINNGFEQWNGVAEIGWHDRNLRLELTTDPVLGYYQLYKPEPNATANHESRFFCFEPMSHCCNAHNLSGNHGLVRLAPGESCSAGMKLLLSTIE